jgi:hypothetical protein
MMLLLSSLLLSSLLLLLLLLLQLLPCLFQFLSKPNTSKASLLSDSETFLLVSSALGVSKYFSHPGEQNKTVTTLKENRLLLFLGFFKPRVYP